MEESGKRLFLAMVAVLLVIVAVFIYSLWLNRTPEAFTQVWLESGAQIAAAKGEAFPVRFVADSHEAGQTVYSYKIMAEGATKASGSITLAAGEKKTVEESISISTSGSQRVDIEISKPEKPEPYTLWFWAEVS